MTYQIRSKSFLEYQVTEKQLSQLATALNLPPDSPLLGYLAKRMNQYVSQDELENGIEMFGHEGEKEVVLRILESRWFHQNWNAGIYYPRRADPNSRDWRLYFALIGEIRKQAESINSEIAIFSANDEAAYDWEISWYRISPKAKYKTNRLSWIQAMKDHMIKNNISLIENTIPYTRSRNDVHPNIEGHRLMAKDIYQFLQLKYKDKLEAHKTGEGNKAENHRLLQKTQR